VVHTAALLFYPERWQTEKLGKHCQRIKRELKKGVAYKMKNTATEKVLTQFVIENANLKIVIEQLKEKLAALEGEKDATKEGE